MPIEPPPTTVSAVVVTAPRLPPSPGDAAFSIVRIDPAELRGAPRLAEALQSVPGVSLFRRTSSAAANPTTQGLSLRSIAPSGAGRALVTLDGVPQNDPFGGWVIWSQLPPEAIEAAYVVRGAGAGPYGAGALTGVVALDELSRPGGLNADAYAGELDSRRAAAAGVVALGAGTLFLSASAEHTGGWIPVREGRGAADAPLSLDDWSLAARWQAPVGPATAAVRVGAYDERRESGLVGAASRASGQDISVTVARQPSRDALGWRAQAWLRTSDLENSSVAVGAGRVSTSPANNQYATPAVGWGANLAVRGRGEQTTWEVGADVRAASGESRELFRNLGAGFTRDRVAGGETLVAGAYAELARASGPWLVTGGVRLDAWASRDGKRVERDLATGLVSFLENAEDRNGVVPTARVGLRRDLTPAVFARAAAYAGFRPPTLNELYRPFRVGNDITEANAGLEPERLYGVEGGLGGTGAADWNVTVFATRIADPVTNVTIGAGPGSFPGFPGAGFIPAGGVLRQRQNAGEINAWGVEADASRRFGERLRLRAAAGYTSAEVDGGGVAAQLTGLRPAQTPKLTLTAAAEWRALDRLTLLGAVRYESARFEDDLNSRKLDPAFTVDVRADWRLTDALSAYVAADNLFDAAVQTGLTADGIASYDAPRVVRAGLSFRR
jgi:outer membrane receptor protein involved in Fe transport